ncbi:MAG TPA: class I SAM-dependent methyltransferase [Longimicrobiaceae bacterium]|nr:class I SAM-dependent methyltransferase [Longimicrobiaceae bacterium]
MAGERYDPVAAAHYAAYRPPLHSMILGRALSGDGSFGVGLDVGCGTGYSAVALAEYCRRVYGIDPSPSMLGQATAHERVSYLGGAAERIPLPDHSVDVVTFAGSLFYADAVAAGEEVARVAREGAVVVVYDFEVLLDEVLRRCGVDPQAGGSDYDHRTNFSGAPGLAELMVRSERVSLAVSASELAHVLLSDSHRYDRFAERYRASDPFPALTGELRSAYDRATIEADVYYSKYRTAAA